MMREKFLKTLPRSNENMGNVPFDVEHKFCVEFEPFKFRKAFSV